jgi:hypothetical protein
MVWLVGALAWFLLAGVRVARFRKLLAVAQPASAEVCDRARRLALRLGLRTCPAVVLLPGRLAPLLWASGGTTLLCLSAGLLEELSPEAIDLLLVHELAHYRRGDHWVRCLEFFTLGLYWWNPIAWYARTRLREAEEQCCDAWVTAILPGSGRQYATALVDTLDYLANTPRPVPTLASGLGEVTDLKRRLKMILRGTTPRSLGWAGGLVVLGLAALLPLWPRQADAEDPREPERAPPGNRETNEEVRRLQQELEQKVREIEEVRRRVEEAARVREIRRTRTAADPAGPQPQVGRRPEAVTRGIVVHIEVADTGMPAQDLEAIIEKIKSALPQGATVTIDVREAGRRTERPNLRPREAGAGERAPDNRDVRVEVRTRREDRRPETRPEPQPPGAPATRSGEGRIEQLERRLEAVMRELEALRREMRDRRPERRPGGGFPPADPAPERPPVPRTPAPPGAPPAPPPPPELPPDRDGP